MHYWLIKYWYLTFESLITQVTWLGMTTSPSLIYLRATLLQYWTQNSYWDVDPSWIINTHHIIWKASDSVIVAYSNLITWLLCIESLYIGQPKYLMDSDFSNNAIFYHEISSKIIYTMFHVLLFVSQITQ